MALSKMGRFLSKAEILGVGVFPPFQLLGVTIPGHLLAVLGPKYVPYFTVITVNLPYFTVI